jgi:hypothetical protein
MEVVDAVRHLLLFGCKGCCLLVVDPCGNICTQLCDVGQRHARRVRPKYDIMVVKSRNLLARNRLS